MPSVRSIPRLLVTLILAAAGATACSSSPPGGSPSSGGTPGTASRPAPLVPSIHTASFRLPSPLQREVVVPTEAGLLLAGGLTSADASLATVARMDPESGALTPLGSLTTPVHDAAGAILGGRLVVFGGGAATSLDTVQAFDPANGTSSVVAHLPGPRSDLAVAMVGTTAYVIGGYDDVSPRREIYATTDGSTFRKVADLPTGLRYPGVAVVGSKIIIVGGQTAAGASAAVLSFDPATRRVRKLATLPTPIGHAAVFPMGGLVCVVGGLTAGGVAVRTVTTIDARTGVVASLPLLHRAITDAGVGLTNNGALIIGGARGSDVAGTVASILVATMHR
ncbi:MAG: hypothetical protein QOI60_1646 [Actinomycetota bacterium]|nr:hypothetical protein [Actinomycetota bacterium]